MRRAPIPLIFLVLAILPVAARGAVTSPAWSIQSQTSPTNFRPGDESGSNAYQVFVTNSGGAATDSSSIVITDELPAGLTVKSASLEIGGTGAQSGKVLPCGVSSTGEASTVTCEEAGEAFVPDSGMAVTIHVGVPSSVRGPLDNRVKVEGGGVEPAIVERQNLATEDVVGAGFEEFGTELTDASGHPLTMAGAHPYEATTNFAVNVISTAPGSSVPFLSAQGDLKEVEVAMPPGLAGNPTAIPRCTAQQFTTHVEFFSLEANGGAGGFIQANECPFGSRVGVIAIQQGEGERKFEFAPIYNLVPPRGMPAQFGFLVFNLPIYINTRVRSDGDYGITAYLRDVTEARRITAARVSIWGSPWDESHRAERGFCAGTCPPPPAEPRPLLRTPSSCGNPLTTTMSFTTWAQPVTGASASSTIPAMSGCAAVPFTPTIESRPSTNVADSPAGLHFDLHLPQKENESPEGLGEADLREAVVRLPQGLVVNPSSADGLGSCTPAQAGLTTPAGQTPAHFDLAPVTCPDASKLGTVETVAPAVDHPLKGSVFLASQEDNPFDSLLAFYIVIEDQQSGIVVKLPAEVTPDPQTGQLTTTVQESPQLPVEDFSFDFFEGARAPLRTPQTCGSFATETTMTPWTAPEGADAHPSSSFAVAAAPHPGGCPTSGPQLPNSPTLQAGTTDPTAGAFSPFVLQVRREDGSQEIKGLDLELPGGLLGKLAGTTECPEADIAAARTREHPGGGGQELAHPSCPQGSRVGTVTAAAGAGPSPYQVSGPTYLAGPYEGARLSLVSIIPAVAGPFDLGSVVARTALQVDPLSARVHVIDRHPYILNGIPLDIRTLSVQTKPGFILNPTSCEPKSLEGSDLTVFDQRAPLSERFQATECGALGFKPSLKLSLKGKTSRTGHPAVHAVVTYPKKGAYSNIASAQVSLPHSEFLDQGSLSRVCTQPELKSRNCPARSVYGHAKAWTPLLDKPLEGPVYLAVGFGYQLPALVAELDGQIRVLLVGKVDTGKNHGLRNTFSAVPDAPVEKFELSLKGGPKYGLIENSEDICRKPQRLAARFVAQNGKSVQLHPKIANSCGGKSGGHKKGKKAPKGRAK